MIDLLRIKYRQFHLIKMNLGLFHFFYFGIATQIFNRTTEKVYAIWNTTAGGDSTPSPPGDFTGTYWPTEPPEAALDGNVTSEYTNHGGCDSGPGNSVECGSNTGFYLTLAVRRFTLVSFRIATNIGAITRDPLMITIEGSNYNESELTFGKSWTLIYNGTTGLTSYFARAYFGDLQSVSGLSMPFTSYRLLVTSKRGQSNCVSYSEFRMMGFIEYD
jgi:hypothetical protein